jgi:hypothetical protein
MHRAIIGLFIVALATASQLRAQDEALGWPVGSRIRVSTLSSRNVVGRLSEVRGDTLIIRTGSGLIKFRKRVHVDSLLSLEISRDRYVSGRRVAGGAFAGAIGGVVLTAVLIQSVGDVCVLGNCNPRDPDYARAALIGGVGGAIAGAITLADRWEKVPSSVKFSVDPRGKQGRLGLSFALPRVR